MERLTTSGWYVVEAYTKGLTDNLAAARRASWRLHGTFLESQARRAAAHADWFCSLPWYRRWLAMVLGH